MHDSKIIIGNNKLHSQLLYFIIIGVIATVFDFVIYTALSSVLPYTISKSISFVLGSALAYLLNKFFTFKQPVHSTRELMRFISLYATTLVANVLVNAIALGQLPVFIGSLLTWETIIILAFIIATGVSTVLNFLGQKFWVFRQGKNTKHCSLDGA